MSANTKRCCRNCNLYDVHLVKDAAGRIQNRRAAPCNWKSIEVYPASVNGHRAKKRPTAAWMQPFEGVNCPTFVLRPMEEVSPT